MPASQRRPPDMTPRFSLVLCTVGRVGDTLRFLDSLVVQTLRSYEVILVDQSASDALRLAIDERQYRFPIKHIISPRGLSLGRNLGIRHVTGDIVAFPDDDCAYPPTTLAMVDNLLQDRSVDGATGKSEDFDGSPSGSRAYPGGATVRSSNIWRCAISYTIFLRSTAIARIGNFDEALGVGCPTPFQSGEETDYLFRALRLGMNIRYTPNLVINHPKMNVASEHDLIVKDFRYGLGMGRVVRKNQLGIVYFIPHIARPLAASIASLIMLKTNQSLRYWKRARGRWAGFVAPVPETTAAGTVSRN
jgi:glycosyltransferase involved in cell wall biosynthesis